MAAVDTIFAFIDTFLAIIFYGWPFILTILIVIMKLKWRAWPVEAIIIEKRGSNLIKTNDRAGRYVDPYTGDTGYKLQKTGDTVPVLNYDWVLHNISAPTTIFDRIVNLLRGNIGTIFLFKYGSRQYKPVSIKENGKSKIVYQEVKDDKGNSIWINVYQPFDPRDKMGALDFEVVDWDNMNFMVNEQRASIMRRQKKSEFLMKYVIPLAIIGASVIVCIIMMKFSYDASVNMPSPSAATVVQGPATVPNIPIISSVMPG